MVDQGDDEAKKRQKRGGKGMVKAKKKEAELEKKITLSIAPRGKKKAVTVVQGNDALQLASLSYNLILYNETICCQCQAFSILILECLAIFSIFSWSTFVDL